MRISSLLGLSFSTLALVGCSSETDNRSLVEAEAQQTRNAAAAGRIWCALDGAEGFRLDCTMDRIASADGQILVLGRQDSGYRRFRFVPGQGVETADGAETASVAIIGDGQIEVTVADDRYRLPATVRGQTASAAN